MRRLLDLDVLACPRCGGRLRRIATGENPAVTRKDMTKPGVQGVAFDMYGTVVDLGAAAEAC